MNNLELPYQSTNYLVRSVSVFWYELETIASLQQDFRHQCHAHSQTTTSMVRHLSSSHFNPCSALPLAMRCLIVLTSSLSSIAATHAAYLGYSASFSSRPSSLNNPSPTIFQVTKDRSAKVHFSPTSQPEPLLSSATSKTLKTR